MKISVQELLIVLAIVLIIFGPTQIPKLMKLFKKKNDSEKEEK
ncbi:MAG: twin-arginine translocase TatA/TatE family subunit [Firmicutes bacterium]|nr:twin-arginine translocase TatA/TatE family subunit [Bacillota bacterium]MDY6159804.1 twin-arginine translocase TatA/TatE family subunit [Candidatus Faecousia sp.]